MHKRSWHPFYKYVQRLVLPYTVHPVVRPSVCNFLCAQLLQFPSELDVFEICHNGTQSFRHPVILHPVSSTLFGRFDQYFGQFDPQTFFCNKWLCRPRSFSSSRILSKKMCFFLAQYVVNISKLFFFLQYIVKSISSPMFMFTFFVLLLQIHYHLDTDSGGIVFADIGN